MRKLFSGTKRGSKKSTTPGPEDIQLDDTLHVTPASNLLLSATGVQTRLQDDSPRGIYDIYRVLETGEIANSAVDSVNGSTEVQHSANLAEVQHSAVLHETALFTSSGKGAQHPAQTGNHAIVSC